MENEARRTNQDTIGIYKNTEDLKILNNTLE